MRLFHRHHWTSVRANLARMRNPLVGNTAGSDVTLVLQRCSECGAVQVVELTGHWTLQQLTTTQVEEARR